MRPCTPAEPTAWRWLRFQWKNTVWHAKPSCACLLVPDSGAVLASGSCSLGQHNFVAADFSARRLADAKLRWLLGWLSFELTSNTHPKTDIRLRNSCLASFERSLISTQSALTFSISLTPSSVEI